MAGIVAAAEQQVGASTFVQKLKEKLHHFVIGHTMLEALVDEKDMVLDQQHAVITRLQDRIAYLENKYPHEVAQSVGQVNAQPNADSNVGTALDKKL